MTSSQEKDLDQAKKALLASNGAIPYSAVEGAGGNGHFASRLNHFVFPAQLTWHDCPELVRKVRDAMAAGSAGQRVEKTLPPETSAPATFLYAVRTAILNPSRRTSGSLIYNGKDYLLRTDKQPDAAMGARFTERNLVRRANRVMRLDAILNEVAKGVRTPFKIWFEAGSEELPPLRFEYQAKPFLRLVFEADATTSVPPVTLALNRIAH